MLFIMRAPPGHLASAPIGVNSFVIWVVRNHCQRPNEIQTAMSVGGD